MLMCRATYFIVLHCSTDRTFFPNKMFIGEIKNKTEHTNFTCEI